MSKRTPEDKSIARAKVNLGKAISKCRSNQKTQRQLALAIGLPPSNLKYIEDGVNAPTAEVYSRLINELKPTVEMRNRMDRLYMTIRKTPPPDVSAVVVTNPCLVDMLRGLAGKQITKEQIAQMNALISSFPQSGTEGEKKHG